MDSGGSRETRTISWFLCSPFRACVSLYRYKVITVEPLIFLFMLAKHLYTPLYEQYYYVKYGSQILQNTSFPFPDGSFCLNSSQVDSYAGNGSFKTVETMSDNLVVYGQIANRIPAMIVTVLLGPLSDRFGRKPLLVMGTVGSTLGAFVSMLIVHFQWNPYYFIVANFLSGVTGDFAIVLSGGFAYVVDISSEKWRGLRIGIIEAVMSIGSGVGPTLVGYWLQWNSCNFIQPLWLYAGCNLAAGLYALVCIPESLTKEERKELTERNPKGLRTIFHGLGIFTGFVPQYSLWKLWAANLVACLMVFNVLGSYLITVYFLKAPPFDVGAQMVGVYQGVYYMSRTLSNTVLMAIFSALKMPEAAIALVAVAFNSGCNLLLGFSKKVYQVYTGIIILKLQLLVHSFVSNGRLPEAIQPRLKTFFFSAKRQLDATSGSPSEYSKQWH